MNFFKGCLYGLVLSLLFWREMNNDIQPFKTSRH